MEFYTSVRFTVDNPLDPQSDVTYMIHFHDTDGGYYGGLKHSNRVDLIEGSLQDYGDRLGEQLALELSQCEHASKIRSSYLESTHIC